MAVDLIPYRESDIPAVQAFNARLQANGVRYRLPESPIPAWLPRSADDRLYQEHFLAVDGDLVRGGYILKHQDFVVAGSVVSIGAFQLPLSEGTYDPAAAGVGVQLLRHALRRQPLLYTLGIGSYAEAAARLLMAARFELVTVPFYFRVINARRFLREIRPLRQTRLRRYAMDLAAMSRTGVVGIHVAHRLRTARGPRTTVVVDDLAAFDDRADALWSAVADAHVWAAVRDRRVLARLYDAPANRFIRVGISDGGELVAWAVLLATEWEDHKYFGAMRTGSIVDVLARPGYEQAVIRAATTRLQDEGVDLIVTNQSSAAICDALRRAGFLTGPSNFLLAVGPALQAKLPPVAASVGQFHFTRGDGDGPINL